MSRTPGAKDKKPRQTKPTGQARGITKNHNPDLPPDYYRRINEFSLAILPTEPLDYNDVPEMERRFARYLELCAEYGVKIGNQGAYTAIGIDKGTAWEWENRNKSNPERTDFIKKVRQICAMTRELLMSDGKVNPVTGIFWQKNYDGMKDQQEVVLTPNNPLGDQEDPKRLEQKYLESTYGMDALPDKAES